MDSDSKKALEAELAKLTILKLRDLAHKNNVDISGTIRKKDIIDKLLNANIPLDSAIEMAMGKRPAEEKAAEAPRKEEQRAEIVEKLPEKVEVTDQKIAEVREYMKTVMGNKPSFFTIDGEIEAVVAKYDSGDFYGAVQDIQKARQKASDVYAHFRIFTNAVGINASEKLLDEAVSRGSIAADRKKNLIDSAMVGLVEGSVARREETLERLERGALAAFDKIIGDLGADIQVVQKRATELQEMGANVLPAVDAIGEADKLRLALQIDKAKLSLEKANDLLRQAEKVRAEELRYSIPRVRSMIEDAKLIGLEIEDTEKDLDKASYYLERGELKDCVEALTKAGADADRILNQRLASDAAMREELLKRAKLTVLDIGPSVSEAHSYGIDASEAYHYISNAQIAINRQDPISAMKFSRRADELARQYGEDLKILKEKSIHIDKLRCKKCGQDMMYDYLNGIRRCANCGTMTKK
jgi:tetratricopeptide (TPR) repeat protein